jgi:asparagine synthase (glutamine-hydrolysing)
MRSALVHRGPDANGATELSHAALGVTRLRIVDLDPRADQPFRDDAHCVSLALNGEIYNASELRRRFPDYPFRSRSDAEVALPLYLADGPEGLCQLDGMFALVIWDEGARRLVVARDRAGEKPLFYAPVGDEVLFASEQQALLGHPEISRDLDQAAATDFLTFGYVREPRTMFRNIHKVCAGTAMVFEASGVKALSLARPSPPDRSSHDPAAALLALLEGSLMKQLVADVPIGVLLSGGLDSSLLAAIAHRHYPSLSTFTVRFPETSYDEGRAARAVSDWLGTPHVEVVADPRALVRAFDHVTSHLAEPLADPAILPTYLVAERARETVGVVLSGEGADELFGGYPTYHGHRLAAIARHWPAALRRSLRGLASRLPASSGAIPLSFLLQRFFTHFEKPWMKRHVAWFGTDLLDRGMGMSNADLVAETAGALENGFEDPASVIDLAMQWDYLTYLRDCLLPKLDRATMLVSLEARTPYLDPALVTFAFALPLRFKLRGLTGKWVLRRAARHRLPAAVIRRRKHGLSVPISRLINGPLASVVDRLFDQGRLGRQGLLNPSAAQQLLREHRHGNYHVARGLWALVIFQRWLECWS